VSIMQCHSIPKRQYGNYYFIQEWYPWELFSEVEEIGKGGYGTVFRAKTKMERIKKWYP
jgi:hypothetical protein